MTESSTETTNTENNQSPSEEQKQEYLALQKRMIDLRFKQAESETANGIMFCSMAIAKGVILELLNQFLEDEAISKADYNRYRDMILELMTPLKTQQFIEQYYLEMNQEIEEQRKEMLHGIPDKDETEEEESEKKDGEETV